MIEVELKDGIALPGEGLWLDPRRSKPLAFVSHAHSDHIASHRAIISSAGTARLMRARLSGKRQEHLVEFNVRSQVDGHQITLLPAGHIHGSSQLFIESAAGSLLYTGDFKLRPGLSTPPAQWCHAETLIMETTFGLPKYRMPPTEETVGKIVEFCRQALAEKAVPILLSYSLGKSQEILCALLRTELVPMLHDAVFKMTEIYREFEPNFPTGYLPWNPNEVAGKVLICPPNLKKTLEVIKNRRTAVLTGWALDPGARYRYQADAAFPLSDHADYPDLLRYVELVKPKRVLTVHGFATAFASDLRNRGVEAWALGHANQLELGLGPCGAPH